MRSKKFISSLLILLVLLLLSSTISLAAPYTAGNPYIEPVQIKELFPNPSVTITTPAFKNNNDSFTTQEEMLLFLYDLQKKAPHMKIEVMGYSQEARELPLIYFSGKNKMRKPTIWLQGQVHGNEPAGGEAMLAIAQDLAVGELKDVLEKVNVIIVPRGNPDGSYYFQRPTARKIDINRDNVKFDLPESIELHQAFNKYKPEVVIDAHEYNVENNYRDVGEKGSLSAYDILMLSSTNPNVPAEITKMADDVFIANAEKSLDENNFSHHWYYLVGKSDKAVKKITMADGNPIIGRNAYGLQPAISILVESRGIGIGKQNFARRVMSQIVVHRSMIRSIADNAMEVMSTVEKGRQDIMRKGAIVGDDDNIIIQSTPKALAGQHSMDFVGLDNFKRNSLPVEAYTNKEYDITLQRERPYAYVIPAAYNEVALRLAWSGVPIASTSEKISLDVESYKVIENSLANKYFEGKILNTVKTEVSKKTVTFPAGSFVIYMNNPNANIAALCLEPEAENSFVHFGIIPVSKGDEIPIYRLMFAEKIKLEKEKS